MILKGCFMVNARFHFSHCFLLHHKNHRYILLRRVLKLENLLYKGFPMGKSFIRVVLLRILPHFPILNELLLFSFLKAFT